MLAYCILGSGSGGNAALLRGGGGTLLLDAGFAPGELIKRMATVATDPPELSAIILTHEHGDHICGAPALARKLGIPVYLSRGTLAGSHRVWRRGDELRLIGTEPFSVAGFAVSPIPVSHDAREPLSFRFELGGCSLVVLTDLGEADAVVEDRATEADGLIVEANHDRDCLLSGPYPDHLKRRILSGFGHLSNDQCADLLRRVASTRLQRVVLAHLSQENNRPLLAWEAAAGALYERGVLEQIISVASQSRPLGWMYVE